MTIEEELLNTIVVEHFSDHYFVHGIEYPAELNAIVIIAKNGKKYRVTVTEEPCDGATVFSKLQ